MTQTTNVTGTDLLEFLTFLEEEKDNGNYEELEYEEITAKDGRKADASILNLIISGSISILSKLIISYLQKNTKNEISFERTNSKGEKMIVNLKDLEIEEVKKLIEEFNQE